MDKRKLIYFLKLTMFPCLLGFIGFFTSISIEYGLTSDVRYSSENNPACAI